MVRDPWLTPPGPVASWLDFAFTTCPGHARAAAFSLAQDWRVTIRFSRDRLGVRLINPPPPFPLNCREGRPFAVWNIGFLCLVIALRYRLTRCPKHHGRDDIADWRVQSGAPRNTEGGDFWADSELLVYSTIACRVHCGGAEPSSSIGDRCHRMWPSAKPAEAALRRGSQQNTSCRRLRHIAWR